MKTPPAIGRFLDESLKMDEDAVGKGAVSRAIQEAKMNPLAANRMSVAFRASETCALVNDLAGIRTLQT